MVVVAVSLRYLHRLANQLRHKPVQQVRAQMNVTRDNNGLVIQVFRHPARCSSPPNAKHPFGGTEHSMLDFDFHTRYREWY